MFTHDLNPVFFEIGFIEIRWYSLAYIFGILIGWYYGKFIIQKKFGSFNDKISKQNFDDFVTYLIISIILVISFFKINKLFIALSHNIKSV